MKRLVFAAALVSFLFPAVGWAKDAGPKPDVKVAAKVVPKKKVAPAAMAPVKKVAAKKVAATTKKTAAPKPVVKVTPKKTPTKAVPASQPTKAEIKHEGKVDLVKEEVKDAEEKPKADEAPTIGDMISSIYTDFRAGKVWNGVAGLLMLLTFIFFKFRKDIPVKYAPWIAAGLGIATNIVSAIIGGVEWGSALAAGLFQGAAAAGFWSMVGKHIFLSKDEKTKRLAARDIVKNGIDVSGTIENKE